MYQYLLTIFTWQNLHMNVSSLQSVLRYFFHVCYTKKVRSCELCMAIHTAVRWFVWIVQTVLFPVTLPDLGNTSIIRDATPELAATTVGYTRFLIHTQKEVIWAVTSEVLTPWANQTQVWAASIVTPTRIYPYYNFVQRNFNPWFICTSNFQTIIH